MKKSIQIRVTIVDSKAPSDTVQEPPESLFFGSILQCATYFKLSCPTIKNKLEGKNVRSLMNYRMEVAPQNPIENKSPPHQVIYWTCETCQLKMRNTSKTCHLISHKHLDKS